MTKSHGMHGTQLYTAWANMKKRVKHPRPQDRIAGMELTYATEWEDFIPFMEWALSSGYEEGLTLDRKDTYGNYEPSNCRWVTQTVQSRNKTNSRMLTYQGKTQCVADWEDELGLKKGTLKSRILRGWDTERALTENLGEGRRTAIENRKRDEKGRVI